jgi:hypothetical protein
LSILCPATSVIFGGYSDFKFLGIYKWKSVRQIGLVENIIEADWDAANGLIIKKYKIFIYIYNIIFIFQK